MPMTIKIFEKRKTRTGQDNPVAVMQESTVLNLFSYDQQIEKSLID